MQHSRYNDIQLLQQHLMLKQLQELQKQQQLPQLCDVRQQNPINYPFAATKHAAGNMPQFSLANGAFPTDTSQFLTNWDDRGAHPFGQGLSNRLSPSVDHGQSLHLTGLIPQRVGASMYGGLAASTRDNESHLRGISPETANLANKISDHQQPISVLQASVLNTSFMGDQLAVSSEQDCMSEGSYMFKQQEKEPFLVGHHHYVGQNMFKQEEPFLVGQHNYVSQNMFGELLPDNFIQTSTSVPEFSWKQDQTDWPGSMQQKPTQMVPLDPLEKKILYNSDDDAWDASFGSDTVLGGSMNTFDPMDTFPSLQSGSWSALMQSAVAETSSGDTGLTEEWSGLTCQNPENSTENQPSVTEGGKQHTGWADNSLQSPLSLTSSPIPAFNNSAMSPSIPVFQPSSFQSLGSQQDGLHRDVSDGAIQKPVTNAIEWLDRYSMQKQSLQGSRQSQSLPHLNAQCAQNYEHSEGDKNQQMISTYTDSRQSFSEGKGENNEASYKVPNTSGALGNANSLHMVDKWRPTGGLDQMQSTVACFAMNREDYKMSSSMSIQNSNIERSQLGASQPMQAYNQPGAMSQVDIPMPDKGNTSYGRNSDQITSASVLHYPFKAINDAYPVENVKGNVGSEQEHLNASDIPTNLPKGSVESGGNLKESEESAPAIDPQSIKSIPVEGSAGTRDVNSTALRNVTEKEWAQATNRLVEKLEDHLEKIKDRSPKLLAKRRLLRSAQLMQQLLRAPPASALSVDAASAYESLTYCIAKVTIGDDAFSLTNYENNGSCMPSNSSSRIHEKVEAFERIDDGYILKAVEDIMHRAEKLEDVLTRVEKAAPFVDINVETQELERYSVINRFAKFHVRGQPNNSYKTSPSSGAATASVPRASPQKYVTGHPLPETLPEGVKCLSL